MVITKRRYSSASSLTAFGPPGPGSTGSVSTHRAAPGPVTPLPIRARSPVRNTAACAPPRMRPTCSMVASTPKLPYAPSSRGATSSSPSEDVCAASITAFVASSRGIGTIMPGKRTTSSRNNTGSRLVVMVNVLHKLSAADSTTIEAHLFPPRQSDQSIPARCGRPRHRRAGSAEGCGDLAELLEAGDDGVPGAHRSHRRNGAREDHLASPELDAVLPHRVGQPGNGEGWVAEYGS